MHRLGREVAWFAVVAAVAAVGWTGWLAVPATGFGGFWGWNLAGLTLAGLAAGAVIVRTGLAAGVLAGLALGTGWGAAAAWRDDPGWVSDEMSLWKAGAGFMVLAAIMAATFGTGVIRVCGRAGSGSLRP